MEALANQKKTVIKGILTALAAVVCLMLTAALLVWGLLHVGTPGSAVQAEAADAAIMDQYDKYMTNRMSHALEGVMAIDRVYWLNDGDQIAPEPDQSRFGAVKDPAQMQAVLEAAGKLLDGQQTLFNTGTQIFPGSQITYYLDDTIFCVTWRQAIGTAVYTFSEVKIAHASQFRRFLADGEYGSDKQYYGTQMAAAVNAVTAANGDFYKNRPYGTVIYNGEIFRTGSTLDVCCVNEAGELVFVHRGELKGQAAWEQFVEENGIRFCLAFGPILVEDSRNVCPENYPLGEVKEAYSRAGLGTLGDLHYLVVTAGFEEGYRRMPTMAEFAARMQSFGCVQAYALDGGQTGTIVTNDQLMNRPDHGTQRTVSDIIYFATAIPEGE